jgi:hypothetical protein
MIKGLLSGRQISKMFGGESAIIATILSTWISKHFTRWRTIVHYSAPQYLQLFIDRMLSLTVLSMAFIWILRKNLILTSQKTQYYSVSRTRLSLLSKEIIIVFVEEHKKHTHCVDNVPIFLCWRLFFMQEWTCYESAGTQISKICHSKSVNILYYEALKYVEDVSLTICSCVLMSRKIRVLCYIQFCSCKPVHCVLHGAEMLVINMSHTIYNIL